MTTTGLDVFDRQLAKLKNVHKFNSFSRFIHFDFFL